MLKKTMNIAFGIVLTISLLSWTTSAVAQSGNAATTFSVPFPHTITGPCDGNTIDLDGTAHVTLKTVNYQNGNSMIIQNVNFSGIKGTSRETGTQYVCVSSQNQKVVINGNTGTATLNVNVTQNLIATGSADDMYLHLKEVYSVNLSTGEHTLVSSSVSFSCK